MCVCCTASRRKEKTRAKGEQEVDDADSEGSELSQDLLTEADFEQLVREAESFVVKSTARRKLSSAPWEEEEEITLEPIIVMSPPYCSTSSGGMVDSAEGCGSETGSANAHLESIPLSQEDLPLEREFSHLALPITEECNPSVQQWSEGQSLLTPTTPLVAASVDGSDGTTPTLPTRGGDVVWEEAFSDVILPLADEECQIPALVVSGEAGHSSQHGHSRPQSSSPTGPSCDCGTSKQLRHPSPLALGCGTQELELPLESTVSGSSSECTSPVPVTGDPLVGLIPRRNPFDDSDTEDENAGEWGGGGERRDAASRQTNKSDGGASCRDEERVRVLTCRSNSPKDQDEVEVTPTLKDSPLTLEEITAILDNGEDERLEGLLDEYDIVDALQEDYYSKEVRGDASEEHQSDSRKCSHFTHLNLYIALNTYIALSTSSACY